MHSQKTVWIYILVRKIITATNVSTAMNATMCIILRIVRIVATADFALLVSVVRIVLVVLISRASSTVFLMKNSKNLSMNHEFESFELPTIIIRLFLRVYKNFIQISLFDVIIISIRRILSETIWWGVKMCSGLKSSNVKM